MKYKSKKHKANLDISRDKTIKISGRAVQQLERDAHYYQSKIEILKKEIKKYYQMEKEINEIERSHRKNNAIEYLKLNKNYIALKNSVKNMHIEKRKITLNEFIKHLSDTREKINKKEIEMQKRLEELRKLTPIEIANLRSRKKGRKTGVDGNFLLKKPRIKNPEVSVNPIVDNTPIIEFEVNWENVYFEERTLKIKYSGKWFEKALPESRRYLNHIKHYYTFKNVPKLKIKARGNVIIEFLNKEVLFYHIEFLKTTSLSLGHDKHLDLNWHFWHAHNISFYRKFLPFAFFSWSLKRLCKYCDPTLPIIPVGEVVINNGGSTIIHNSFLFPMKGRNGTILIWESSEESKASYIFSLSQFEIEQVQVIFNYITGSTSNKRWTLINSSELRKKLNMIGRVFHTDKHSWERNIRIYWSK